MRNTAATQTSACTREKGGETMSYELLFVEEEFCVAEVVLSVDNNNA
ncbi:hypothetical protein MGAST_16995 [Mycobacterium gastri 'Wayne']|nr:hypothetical protein MGAST_16995 [Mycobacterium gastri 'Wayne']